MKLKDERTAPIAVSTSAGTGNAPAVERDSEWRARIRIQDGTVGPGQRVAFGRFDHFAPTFLADNDPIAFLQIIQALRPGVAQLTVNQSQPAVGIIGGEGYVLRFPFGGLKDGLPGFRRKEVA